MHDGVRHCVHPVVGALLFGPGVGPVYGGVHHDVHLVAVDLVGPVVGPVHDEVCHCVLPVAVHLLVVPVVDPGRLEVRSACCKPQRGVDPVVGPDPRVHCHCCRHHQIGTKE